MRARFVGSRTKFRTKSRCLGGKDSPWKNTEKNDGGERMDGQKEGREEGREAVASHTHVKLGEFRYNGYLYARLESVIRVGRIMQTR